MANENLVNEKKENCCENQCMNCKCKIPMIIGSVIFSLMMLAFGVFLGKTYFSAKQNSTSAVPTPVAVAPSQEAISGAFLENWKEYKNSDFTFKYPPNWQVENNGLTLKTFAPQITIYTFSANEGGMMNECMRLDESTAVGNLLVKNYSRVATGEMCGNPIASESGAREKWISMAGGSGFAPGIIFRYDASQAKEAELIFNQILSTFKFTNLTATPMPTSETENWKIYSDKDIPFQVKHPANWNLRKTYGKSVSNTGNYRVSGIDISTNLSIGSTIIINLIDPQGISFTDWVKLYSGETNPPLTTNFIYREHPSILIETFREGKPALQSIYYEYRGFIVFIEINTSLADQAVADRILSTFKLL